MDTDIEEVAESIIDELRNYKGFRRWWDNWDDQEQIEKDINNVAMQKHLELLIARAEKDFDETLSPYTGGEIRSWFEQQLNEMEE